MTFAALMMLTVVLVVFLAGASLLAVTAVKKRKAKEGASQSTAS